MALLGRILTALILIPVVVAMVLWTPAWLFLLGLLPFAFLSLREYAGLMGKAGCAPAFVPLGIVATGVLLVQLYRPDQLLGVVAVGAMLLLIASFLQRGSLQEIPGSASASVFGLLYVALPFALVLQLREGEQGAWVVLYLLILVWTGDTAAYFVGRALGRHKLAPALSPGKTVEGTIGGVVLTVAVGYWLFHRWFGDLGASGIHAWALPLVTNMATQLGDLAESALKRGAGVKDSSNLLPGHGGVLDRVDGLLFAAPALWYYWNALILGAF